MYQMVKTRSSKIANVKIKNKNIGEKINVVAERGFNIKE